jgi:hypothetical protein
MKAPAHAGSRGILPPRLAGYLFTSSLFLPLQKRRRPSRSDGSYCEKGVASSGEKTVSRVLPASAIIPSH